MSGSGMQLALYRAYSCKTPITCDQTLSFIMRLPHVVEKFTKLARGRANCSYDRTNAGFELIDRFSNGLAALAV